MEGTSSGNCSMMAFGENSSGLCPMMMMPLVTSRNASHNPINPNLNYNPNADTNSPFFPMLMPCTNSSHDPNRSNSGTSSMMPENNNHSTNNAGLGYFMEINHNHNNNNDGSSSSSSAVKTKIMAHPQYHRLLAAYVNCQKVRKKKRKEKKRKHCFDSSYDIH